jgi:hypothetical protein
MARRLDSDPSTISRELRRNAATRGGKLDYRASVAQWKAELLARRPKTARLVVNEPLREYVQERLAGQVRLPDGTPVTGPGTAPWKGRNKPRRQDRRWANAWSPEQIFHRLKVDFLDDESMRISHERRSTRSSTSRAAGRSNASWWLAYAPAERCGFPVLAPGNAATGWSRPR